MKQSPKARRLARHHKKINSTSKLNLVALMDIFTILVFFLIVNQSKVRVLQNIKEINLPVSIADKLPEENLVITVLNNRVLIQEKVIWQQSKNANTLSQQNNVELTTALKNELAYQANRRIKLSATELKKGRAVTIIGDAATPYAVLKQIIAACANSDYRNVSLAVKQHDKTKQSEG
ncbi:MAG: biopolymer transporter ExbD [Alteromonadaceae bacterium]|nr:biopolymer transporter ExbD [Alteromonadaceae bacterium]